MHFVGHGSRCLITYLVTLLCYYIKGGHILFLNIMINVCIPPPVTFIITVKDSKRRLSFCSSVESEKENEEYQEEDEGMLPVLNQPSQLLQDHHLQKLAAHMPARTQGYPWNLVYSTAIHGSSLKTLYRNMADLDSPVLLVIRDMHNKVFGAFSSDPFKVSQYCYGTGETFLFKMLSFILVEQISGIVPWFLNYMRLLWLMPCLGF
uniref:Nuclear receptor coactivator 7a n=1 Tax=Nothobranchius furzeri TaxID=105023 RepID=A0A8C6KW21_NOTFU